MGYFSVEEGYSYFTSKQLEDKEGIAVAEVMAEVNMSQRSKYLFTAIDGYAVEIEAADMEKGILYTSENGEINVFFAGLPKNTHIKGLLSIEAVEVE